MDEYEVSKLLRCFRSKEGKLRQVAQSLQAQSCEAALLEGHGVDPLTLTLATKSLISLPSFDCKYERMETEDDDARCLCGYCVESSLGYDLENDEEFTQVHNAVFLYCSISNGHDSSL
jgi:hypothetical protein